LEEDNLSSSSLGTCHRLLLAAAIPQRRNLFLVVTSLSDIHSHYDQLRSIRCNFNHSYTLIHQWRAGVALGVGSCLWVVKVWCGNQMVIMEIMFLAEAHTRNFLVVDTSMRFLREARLWRETGLVPSWVSKVGRVTREVLVQGAYMTA